MNSGLEGIVAAETRLSMVDGENGRLVIGGYRVEELANASFERTVSLLWGIAGFDGEVKVLALPAHTLDLLRSAAGARVEPMDALRMAAGTLTARDDGEAAQLLVVAFPT